MVFAFRAALAVAFLLVPVTIAAADGIEIDDPWARASLGRTPNSAAYMIIRSAAPDRLIAAASPVADRVVLHTTTMDGGVARMRPLEALEIAPGQPATLQPGGLHLMLMGVHETLVEGRTVPLELTFEGAGTVEVEAEIRGLGAATGGGHGGQHGRGAGG